MSVRRDPVGPGQESVWDYPRPPRAERTDRHLLIRHGGVTLAETRRAIRTLETSHPPTYYFPPEDVDQSLLRAATGTSFCEWKGHARYVDVVIGDELLPGVGWFYPKPTPGFELLANHIAFYAAPFDEVLVDGVQVKPQPGCFCGGWITPDLAGPFKGVPGSRFW